MKKPDINLLKTSDLNLSSSLLSLGFDIIGIDSNNPNKQYFYFKRTKDLDDAVDAYWKDELKVLAKSVSLCRRDILNRIFNQKNDSS